MSVITASSLLLASIGLEARGGRGGGGGGGRGAGGARGASYSGGRTINRTPTMSRASSRPAIPQTKPLSQAKPSISQGKVQTPRQSTQQRSPSANQLELRSQVNQNVQSRPAQDIGLKPDGQRAQYFSNNRSNQIVQNKQLFNQVNQKLQSSRPNYNRWFDQNFFDRHDIDLDYAGTRANWWKPAAWTTLATWGSWNWSTPYYYDNLGYTYPLTASEYMYSHSYDTTALAEMHSSQASNSSASTGGEWLPLGVFAVANTANAAAYTNRFIQLAINRRGEIAGVLYNSTTDVAQNLTGMVDPSSQKAYWSMTNKANSPIASTGIYNLTEDQTPIKVRFSDGSEQTWSLVRLQQKQ